MDSASVVIVGGGIAGLSFALDVADHASVAILANCQQNEIPDWRMLSLSWQQLH
mgnify:CR=1 FL=1